MEKAWQLVPLFVTGFLISRMIARTGLAERALHIFIRRSNGSFGSLLLFLLMAAIFLSLFIPNMLTVLALLPIFERLSARLRFKGPEAEKLVTPLILTLIYGANIGGMGSLVGSPANALMLVFLELFRVPGREQINFVSWLTWGIPFVLVFGLLAWLLILFFLVPKKMRTLELSLPITKGDKSSDEQQIIALDDQQTLAARISIGSMFFWLALSFATSLFPQLRSIWDGMAVLFGFSFVWLVFGWAPPEGEKNRRPLLKLSDCYTELPWRGVYLAGAAVAISLVLFQLGVPNMLVAFFKTHIPGQIPFVWFILSLVLVTTFSTELFSNTAASAALFPIAYQLSTQMGWAPLPAMMGVALASTCAFMSPLATPATGLAFGGVRGGSLRSMLWLGFLTNLLGGLWLVVLLTTILPWFYKMEPALPK